MVLFLLPTDQDKGKAKKNAFTHSNVAFLVLKIAVHIRFYKRGWQFGKHRVFKWERVKHILLSLSSFVWKYYVETEEKLHDNILNV